MTASSALHHVGIVVQSLEASVDWYVEHLGFERLFTFGWPGVQASFIGRGPLKLEFFQNEEAEPMATERRDIATNLKTGGINHFAVEVDDLDAEVARLMGEGVPIVSPPREVPNSGGSRYAFIHDNEGMLIELIQQR